MRHRSLAYSYFTTHCDFIAIISFFFYKTSTDFLYCHSRFAYTVAYKKRSSVLLDFVFFSISSAHACTVSILSYRFLIFHSIHCPFFLEPLTRKRRYDCTKEMNRMCSLPCTWHLSIWSVTHRLWNIWANKKHCRSKQNASDSAIKKKKMKFNIYYLIVLLRYHIFITRLHTDTLLTTSKNHMRLLVFSICTIWWGQRSAYLLWFCSGTYPKFGQYYTHICDYQMR